MKYFLFVAEKSSRLRTATVCLVLCLSKMSSHFTNTNFNGKYSNCERHNGAPFYFIDENKQNKIIDNIKDLPDQPKTDEKDNNTNKKVAEKGEEVTLSQTPIETICDNNNDNGKKVSINKNFQLCTSFRAPLNTPSELETNNKDTACKPNITKIAFYYVIIHHTKERWVITVLDFVCGEFGLGHAKKLSFHSAVVDTTGGSISFFGICGQLITYLQLSTKNRNNVIPWFDDWLLKQFDYNNDLQTAALKNKYSSTGISWSPKDVSRLYFEVIFQIYCKIMTHKGEYRRFEGRRLLTKEKLKMINTMPGIAAVSDTENNKNQERKHSFAAIKEILLNIRAENQVIVSTSENTMGANSN